MKENQIESYEAEDNKVVFFDTDFPLGWIEADKNWLSNYNNKVKDWEC